MESVTAILVALILLMAWQLIRVWMGYEALELRLEAAQSEAEEYSSRLYASNGRNCDIMARYERARSEVLAQNRWIARSAAARQGWATRRRKAAKAKAESQGD